MTIPPDQYDLYAEFGIAAEKAQLVEFEAGNAALSFVALFVNTDDIDAEQKETFRNVLEDINRRTLGDLLKNINKIITLDKNILDITNEALEKRNYLCHKFFRNHNFAIFDVAGRKEMVDELKVIQSKLDLAHRMLGAVSDSLQRLAGIGLSEEMVRKFQARGKRIKI